MKRRKMSLIPLDSTVLLIGLYEDTGHLSIHPPEMKTLKQQLIFLKMEPI